jgi:hypothetical protein
MNVVPRAPAAGGGVDVRAELEPVEEEIAAQYGEPQWMKVFKVESDLDLRPEDLNRLLLGVADGIVPAETEIETEWKLIQSKPGDAEGDNEDADVREDRLADDRRALVRRYEFYAYIGPRDPENNEAMPCVDDDAPVPLDAPLDGCADLGDFAGAQNVAIDLVAAAPAPTPTPTPSPAPVRCQGDCGGDGQVTVDELVTMVRIALGDAAVAGCPDSDVDGDGAISIDELILAVTRALAGCT